jgi:hypothetical protein
MQSTCAFGILQVGVQSPRARVLTHAAGQEVYYLSHSVHFTQRCLYILTWTPPQPASHAGALSPPLTLEQLLDDLRLWLQMLAQHVPNAKLILVGTRDDGSDKYQSMRSHIEAAVDAEIEQLNWRVGPECRELRRMEGECERAVAEAKERWTASEVGRQFEGGLSDSSDDCELEAKWWEQQRDADVGLEEWQRRIAKEIADGMKRAQMLRQRIELMGDGTARLERVAREQSFSLDCLSGRGVAGLQAQLSGLCLSHVLGMGQQLPGWWLLALNALQEGASSEPMTKAAAIECIRRAVRALSSPDAHPDSSIWAILTFWADLGRIFVYEDFVLPDPLRLVELIKPLLHHDPPFLMDEACSEEHKALLLPGCSELSSRSVCLGYLRRLKHQAVLHRDMLPLLRAWTTSCDFHEAMLKFLTDCHLICPACAASDASSEVLVTARSRDLPAFYAPYPPALVAGLKGDGLSRHEELHRKHEILHFRFDNLISSSDSCRVLFLLSRHHIGIISRLQAFVHSARPGKINMISKAGKDCLFICRGRRVLPDLNQHCCSVRVLPCCSDAGALGGLAAFFENDGPLSKKSDRQRCGVVVAANDIALLTFMVRCIEETVTRWSICADSQCYVQGPSENCPFIRFASPAQTDACALALSSVLTGNVWNAVVPGVSARDIFPRQRRCAVFLSCVSAVSDNTCTRYACQILRNGFQEAALCSVWMDCADASQSRPWKVLVREGLQAANVYIVCLTPLYLTRPNCLAELNDILTLLEMFPDRKHIIIMPLHPAMTACGRRHILDTRFVLLPDYYQASGPPVMRKHVLSSVSLALLERLSIYDPDLDQPDLWTEKCLDAEPWLSTSPEGVPNIKWNGAEAMFDMCRAIVDEESRGLTGLLMCADDKPIAGFPFLDERKCESSPPSQTALSSEVSRSSIVDSVDGFEAVFHLFSKADAVHLSGFGVTPNQLCDLLQNSNDLGRFPRYLQRVFRQVNYLSAASAVGGCEDLSAFLEWAISPPEKPASRKVVCRVEGSDDVLLLHALFKLKMQCLKRVPASWKEFSYSCDSAVVKIRDRKVLVANEEFDVSSFHRVRSLQGMAKLKNKKENPDFELRWMNVDDHDLNAFETRARHPDRANDMRMFTWRWGRAIENYLLPVTAPAALYMQGDSAASKLTAEVFVAIARRFFPVVSEMESQKGRLCGHLALKWNDLIGSGWKACLSQQKWGSLLHSADVRVHLDPDTKSAAESLRNFSIELLGVAALLVVKHDVVYGSRGSRADEWLVHMAAVRSEVRQGKYDVLSARANVEKVDWKRACMTMLALPAAKTNIPLNRGDADDSALWFNLPAVCSFLANVCSCKWLGDVLGNHADAASLKQAAASVLNLIQHALCVLLLGCDPAYCAPQSMLLSTTECPCFLPLVGCEGNAGDKQKKIGKCAITRCFHCGRDGTLHALRQHRPSSPPPLDFLVELCRVGSVGWEAHAYMEAVHGRTHLGVEFTAAHISESHRLYEQYLSALLFGTAVDSARYLEMTAPAVPAVTVYAITDGKTRDGQMLPLLELRRAEFDRVCGHIQVLIEAPADASAAGTPTAPASSAVAAAGGGRAAMFSALPCTGGASRPATSSRAPPHAAPVTAPAVSSSAKIATSAVMSAASAVLLDVPSTDAMQSRHMAVFSASKAPVFLEMPADCTLPALIVPSSLEADAALPGLLSICAASAASAASGAVKRDILIGLALAATCFFVAAVIKRRH